MTGYSARQVTVAYGALNALFTLAASLIWAINTVFLVRVGGLTLFEVMVVNAVFTVAQMFFEVPTGVIADTIGRKASILLSMATLAVSTLMYVAAPRFGWGFAGFAAASVILGLGYTFQTGAIDAWVVDALDASGHAGAKEHVFARGQIASGIGMLAGSLAGGLLGQVSLELPYVVRAVLIAVCGVLVMAVVRDAGFERRPLRLSTFGSETRRIFDTGVRFGWHSRVVRPLLGVSALGGIFYMYGFYAWQPYALQLLAQPRAVWVLGVAQALFSAAGIGANALVGRIMGDGEARRDPARVLEVLMWASAASALSLAALGFLATPGIAAGVVAIALWTVFGFVSGVYAPIRMGYINEHIPSSQRATILSLDAFFGDAGGGVGQPALGWLSDQVSIRTAWALGACALLAAAPLYRVSGAAARSEREM